MKKIIIGLMLLASVSAFSETVNVDNNDVFETCKLSNPKEVWARGDFTHFAIRVRVLQIIGQNSIGKKIIYKQDIENVNDTYEAKKDFIALADSLRDQGICKQLEIDLK